jgi:hypothetical protein
LFYKRNQLVTFIQILLHGFQKKTPWKEIELVKKWGRIIKSTKKFEIRSENNPVTINELFDQKYGEQGTKAGTILSKRQKPT